MIEIRLGNGDGNIDIVSTSEDIGMGWGVYNVRLGAGSGSFGSVTSFTGVDINQSNLFITDLTGDGIQDLVASNSSGGVELLRGNGNGSFQTAVRMLASVTGQPITSMSIEDFNGDGVLDLFIFDFNGDAEVALGRGDGTFSSSQTFDSGLGANSGLGIGDFNNDGVLDVVGLAGTDYAVSLQSTTSGLGALLSFDLTSQARARQAAPVFEQALDRLHAQRGIIGAYSSRLQAALNVLGSKVEAQKGAEARIRDVDVALEVTNLTRLQIIRNVATAVLAQANQQPQLSLRLLG